VSAVLRNDSGKAEQDLKSLSEDWVAAELRGDSAFVERLLAEDFVAIGPRGFMLTRQEWLQRITSGALKYQQLDWDEVKVRVYGDTQDAAIVTGRQVQKATFQGQPVDTELRTMLVFVKQQGRWLLAGLQLSPIMGPPAGPPPGAVRPAAGS
jgi:uncharacterized protein (TIGR02246 family)